MDITVLTLDNKKYGLLDVITIDNHTYFYLFNLNNGSDFLIQEYDKNDKKVLKGVDDETFYKLLDMFSKSYHSKKR